MAATSSSNLDLFRPSFCLVSGASKGIGRAIAIEVSKCLGPDSVLLLWARSKKDLAVTASLCESSGVKVLIHSIDLSKASEKEMNDNIEQALTGRKMTEFDNCLIYHNVASLGNLAVEASRMENVEEMRSYFDLNVFKVISLNTQFLKIFEEIEDRIIIVNLTSGAVKKPMGGNAYYCSGKAARETFFKVLADEKKHIKVLNYCPGAVDTDMISYGVAETINDNFRDLLTSLQNHGTLLKPEVTAKQLMKVLLAGKFSPGEHVNYFDDILDPFYQTTFDVKLRSPLNCD